MVIATMQRSKGHEYSVIKFGIIFGIVSFVFYFALTVSGSYVLSHLASAGLSTGTAIIYYGMWVFVKKIRYQPKSSDSNPRESR
jgi:hypothetical protein|tara:strand:+ start:485 stop:736 length:252 start_codon:yes stop_codon:yes gene_type:complete